MFNKLLRALTSSDLSSVVSFDMEWLMLHGPLFARISRGYSIGVLLHLIWYKHFSLSHLFILFSFIYICRFMLFLLFSFCTVVFVFSFYFPFYAFVHSR